MAEKKVSLIDGLHDQAAKAINWLLRETETTLGLWDKPRSQTSFDFSDGTRKLTGTVSIHTTDRPEVFRFEIRTNSQHTRIFLRALAARLRGPHIKPELKDDVLHVTINRGVRRISPGDNQKCDKSLSQIIREALAAKGASRNQ